MKSLSFVVLSFLSYHLIVGQNLDLALSLYKEGNPSCKQIFFSYLNQSHPADSLHLSAYYLSGVYYAEDSVEGALTYGHQSLELAYETDNDYHIMRAYMRLFQSYYKWNSFKEAKAAALSALDHSPDDGWLHRNQYNLALAYRKLNQLDSALWYFSGNYDYYLQQKDTLQVCKNLNEIGLIYFYLKDYPKSRLYYKDLLDFSTHVNSKMYQGYALNNIGNSYKTEGIKDSAIIYLSRSIPFHSNHLAMAINYNLAGLVDNPYPYLLAAKGFYDSELDSKDYKSVLLDLRAYHTNPDSIHHYESLLADLVAQDLETEELLEAQNNQLKVLEIENQIARKRKDEQIRKERMIWIIGSIVLLLVVLAAAYYYARKYFPEKMKEKMNILAKQNAEFRNTLSQMSRILKK